VPAALLLVAGRLTGAQAPLPGAGRGGGARAWACVPLIAPAARADYCVKLMESYLDAHGASLSGPAELPAALRPPPSTWQQYVRSLIRRAPLPPHGLVLIRLPRQAAPGASGSCKEHRARLTHSLPAHHTLPSASLTVQSAVNTRQPAGVARCHMLHACGDKCGAGSASLPARSQSVGPHAACPSPRRRRRAGVLGASATAAPAPAGGRPGRLWISCDGAYRRASQRRAPCRAPSRSATASRRPRRCSTTCWRPAWPSASKFSSRPARTWRSQSSGRCRCGGGRPGAAARGDRDASPARARCAAALGGSAGRVSGAAACLHGGRGRRAGSPAPQALQDCAAAELRCARARRSSCTPAEAPGAQTCTAAEASACGAPHARGEEPSGPRAAQERGLARTWKSYLCTMNMLALDRRLDDTLECAPTPPPLPAQPPGQRPALPSAPAHWRPRWRSEAAGQQSSLCRASMRRGSAPACGGCT
jgi:hypothetical protein